jgi:hypothetical protein
MLANRALVECAKPVPQEALMHDHWFALVAAALGHVEPVYESLVAYRQHGRNSIGAQAYGWRRVVEKLISERGRKDISGLQYQAAIFFKRYGDQLKSSQAKLVDEFSRLQEKSWFGRRFFMLQHGILRHGVARNLVLLFHVRMAGEGRQKRGV